MPQRIDLQGFGQDDLALSRKGTLLHPRLRENSARGRLRWRGRASYLSRQDLSL
jgi:hypothetical protein